MRIPEFMRLREWSLAISGVMITTRVHACTAMYACARRVRVWVSSGPPTHFYTQTDIKGGFELTPRVGAALHATRNFTSLPLQQHQTHTAIHIKMNRWEFCHAPNPSLRKDKTSKEQEIHPDPFAGGETACRCR